MRSYVHDPAVDVAKLLEAKEPRTVGGVIEGEALCRSALNCHRLISSDSITVVA